MAQVTLKHIAKSYDKGTTFAVKDFNLETQGEEFIVFVGPSGCGKTTTLRMIAGLEEISQGELYIDGQQMNQVAAKDRDIAMVFQNYALYPHMTVYQNIAFSLKQRRYPKAQIQQKVAEVAEILNLTPLLERKPKALSGGEKQRVALGRAIVRQPKVFLMDEPLSNLDAKLRTQTRSELLKLHRQLKTTFIYVTHDQVEAMTMGDRIVVMDQGEIQQIDTPVNLYRQPANLFVAGFIGTPQINLLPAAVCRQEETYGLQFTQGGLTLPQALGQLAEAQKTVICGIRSEDVRPGRPYPGCRMEAVRGRVQMVEHLGAEVIVYADTENGQVLFKTAADQLPPLGQPVELYFNLERLHLFDQTSGVNLASASSR